MQLTREELWALTDCVNLGIKETEEYLMTYPTNSYFLRDLEKAKTLLAKIKEELCLRN